MHRRRFALNAVGWSLTITGRLNSEPQPRLQFEVASIKPAGEGARLFPQLQVDATRVYARTVSLRSLILEAFDVESYQVVGTEKWMDNDLYVFSAKLPSPSTRSQIHEMLRNLLADRFGLRTHYEKRQTKAYELLVAKGGPKLQVLREGESSGIPMNPDPAQMTVSAGTTTTDLTRYLNSRIGPTALGFPVVDHTGLLDRYRIWITYKNKMDPDGRGGTLDIDYLTELPRQIGLELRSGRAECSFLVVDHGERPTTD